MRRDAYLKAITYISGASDTIFDYLIKRHAIDGRMNPLVVTEFIAAYTRELAPSILVTKEGIKSYLEQFTPLIIEGAEIVETLNATVQKTTGGYIARKDTPEAKRLIEWRDKVKTLEAKTIQAMKTDLGI